LLKNLRFCDTCDTFFVKTLLYIRAKKNSLYKSYEKVSQKRHNVTKNEIGGQIWIFTKLKKGA
jgi:hypothetical protein